MSSSYSVTEVVRKLGLRSAGGNHARIKELLKIYGISTTHFLGSGSNVGKTFPQLRKPFQEILTIRSDRVTVKARLLRRALIEAGITYCCSVCVLGPVWEKRELTLQVDHINGDKADNRQENLRFLCPNCHTQTDNFGALNKQALVVQLVDTQR